MAEAMMFDPIGAAKKSLAEAIAHLNALPVADQDQETEQARQALYRADDVLKGIK